MERRGMRIEDLLDFRFPGDAQIDPAGRRVAFAVTEFDRERNGYRSAIWLAHAPAAGDPAPARLTWGGRRDRCPRWSPDGSRLALLSERSGEDQVWLLDTGATGEARQLTRRQGGVSAFAWSPDGTRLAVVGKDPKPEPDPAQKADAMYITRLRYKFNGQGYRDDRRAHIYIADAGTGETRQLTWGPCDDGEPAFSPDGATLAFTSARGDPRDPLFGPDLYTVPTAGGEPKALVRKPGGLASPAFSPDGRTIAYLAGTGENPGESVGIWLAASDGGVRPRRLAEGFDHHAGCAAGSDLRRDAGSAGPLWIEEGRALLAIFSDGPAARVYRIEAESGAAAVAAGTGEVAVSSFSATADGRRLAGIQGDALHPAEVWTWGWGAGAEATAPTDSTGGRPLSALNAGVLARLSLAAPEHVPYESFDGRPIDAWALRPVGAAPGRHPLILEIHGGPHAAYGYGMFHEFQVLAALGYGVLYANPRGSVGYGEAFARACVDDWGGGDYRDLMAAVDMACTWDWVDPGRLGVTGGSYGGFMTNWITGHTGRFAAAVTARSISSFYTKYGVADNGWTHNRRELGDADLWEGEGRILAASPIRYARYVRTPTLIIHSEEDYRCPLEQAEQWYTALRRLGVPTALLRFAGENHELSRSGRPANRLERLRRMAEWFDRYLRPRAARSRR